MRHHQNTAENGNAHSLVSRPNNSTRKMIPPTAIQHLLPSSAVAPSCTTSRTRIFPPTQIHSTWPTCCSAHASLTGLLNRQLLRNRSEQLFHILSGLCGRLEEEQVCFAGIGFGVGGRDSALVRLLSDEIGLVAGERDDDVLVCLALELFYPGFGFVEGGLDCVLVHEGG